MIFNYLVEAVAFIKVLVVCEMFFEPPPRPQDLGIILEAEEKAKKRLQLQKQQSQKSKNFDIYKDMNIPKACSILGIKDKEFREGTNKTLKNAFAKKFEQSIRPSPVKATSKYSFYYAKDYDIESKLQRGQKSKSTELQLMHEAYQYLLKRKALQVKRYLFIVILI